MEDKEVKRTNGSFVTVNFMVIVMIGDEESV